MAHRQSTLERPDALFIAWVKMLLAHCIQYASEWQLSQTQIDRLSTLVAAAIAAYEANSDPATRNATTSINKKFAFSELKHFLGLFIDTLEGDTLVPDTEIATMELRPRTHTASHPLPPPTEFPVLVVEKHNDEITVYVHKIEHDHPTETLAPGRYHGFILRYSVEGDPTEHTEVSSRLHHTLYFERTDEGKKITMSAAWVNSRLQPGPFCKEHAEIIG